MTQASKLYAIRALARLGFVATAFAVAFVLTAPPVQAQTTARLKIDFQFVAGGKTLEPGTYEIEATGGRVILRSTSSKAEPISLLVITRLGRHDADPDVEVVFDKIGDKSVLSELWLPKTDGYLVLSTKEPHEHRVLGGSNPHK
jgi:hypothetical protein